MDLSIIIPSYREPYLNKTVNSVLENSETEIEVFVVLDGYEPEEELSTDPRVKIIKLKENKGMRGSVNTALPLATGKYLLKTDAHCAFAKGFDKVLMKDCAENQLIVPRRYSLIVEGWKQDKPDSLTNVKDYHYLSSPTLTSNYGNGIFPIVWFTKNKERVAYEIDDIMTMQGSCYFVNRAYFMDHVGYLDDNPNTYGSFTGEPLEVGLKYWLGGGEMKVNKKTWYAHLFKSRRFYGANPGLLSAKKKIHNRAQHEWGAKHWINNEEPNMIHPFSWLVEKFWPLPGWPEDRNEWRYE